MYCLITISIIILHLNIQMYDTSLKMLFVERGPMPLP